MLDRGKGLIIDDERKAISSVIKRRIHFEEIEIYVEQQCRLSSPIHDLNPFSSNRALQFVMDIDLDRGVRMNQLRCERGRSAPLSLGHIGELESVKYQIRVSYGD